MKYSIVWFGLFLSVLTGCASSQQNASTSATTSCTSCQLSTQTQAVAAVPAPAVKAAPAVAVQATSVTQKDEGIVKIKIETNMGVIEANLFAAEVPKTVENFVKLTEKGFYDGIIFHRVIPDFMVQTGDPTGTGMGGPGYQFADEFSPKLKHNKPGIFSMANSGPGTNGSQFFITAAATPWLDNKHSVFGEVTAGMDVVTKISLASRDRRDKPVNEIKMIKVSVVK